MNQLAISPPQAKQVPVQLNYHGKNYTDFYYWLRDKENEDVLEYLRNENTYTEDVMRDTVDLQNSLFEEMKARVQENDQTVPVFENGYYYYTRTEEGKQYQIHCRKKGSITAEEEILIDENKLSKGKAYFSLGEFAVSPNNNLLAYSVDYEGDESYQIFILNLTNNTLNQFSVQETYYGLEWDNDNQSIYYTKFDESHRPFQVWRHQINADAATDELVFEEPDASYFVELSKTKDNAYLLLNINSQITSEVWFKDANISTNEFTCIRKRELSVEYEVDHYKNTFYIITNKDKATNFKLMKIAVADIDHNQWEVVLPYNESHYLQGLECFEHYFVIEERVNGQQQIRVFDQHFQNEYSIPFQDEAFAVKVGDNPEFESKLLRLHYRSLVTPNTTYDFDLEQRKLIERKVQHIPSGYDANEYTTERIFATASDGEQVPISLVYKKSLKNQTGNPLYLYGYGSYGVTVDPYFSIAQLSLLNRGFVFAIATVRGGSEKGRTWYEAGKFLQKKNSFTDFIACAEHLIEHGFTTSKMLVANGGSAGGLLMGAVANMAPELFKTIVADVPFVDVINTMMDETIPLTVIEYDEWGNPNDEQFFEYMLSYSPYDNVEAKNYPNLLVTAGLNDPRVQYWEPAKWVAKLRELKTDQNLLLLKTNMDSGHSGASGRFDRLKETAFEYAFILKTLDSSN